MTRPILEAKGLHVSFNGVKAADDVSITIHEGEFLAIIGPNGSGKTTLLNICTGYIRPRSGSVLLDGHDITHLSPRAIARRGVARAFQIPQLFSAQRMIDNMMLALAATDGLWSVVQPLETARRRDEARALLDLVGLAGDADRISSTLPEGHRKLLDIAVALALKPRLLLLDEPTSGVSALERFPLMEALMAALRQRPHHRTVRGARHGRGRALCEPRPGVERRQYHGRGPARRGVQQCASPPTCHRGGLMLRLDKVSVSIEGVRVLRGVSCEIIARKTTVLIGRNGAGKTTALRAIMGLIALDEGSVRLDADDLGGRPAYTRARAGIGYAPEDRRLIPELSVEENIRLPALALKLGRGEIAHRLEEIYQLLPELQAMRSRPAGGVSGGQGKMVALGRALTVAGKVLLLDEPFQGLAPALALDYARTLGELRKHRPELAMLITESSPALLDRIADRTLQIERGEILTTSTKDNESHVAAI